MRTILSFNLFTFSLFWAYFIHVQGRPSDQQCEAFKLEKTVAPYEAAICTMVQNESPYLLEWIEYHRLIGFSHFFIYNDRGTDDTPQKLQPYIDAGIVSLIFWDGNKTVDESRVPVDPPYTRNQRFALADCIFGRSHLAKWIGIWDIDEFLYLADERYSTIHSLVREYAVPRQWTSVHLPSTIFGPSNYETRPTGLIIDNYRWRSGVVAFGYVENKTIGFSGKTLYKSGCAMPEVHHSPFPPDGCKNGDWPGLIEDNGQKYNPEYPVMLKHYKSKSYEDFIYKTEKWKIGVHSLSQTTLESFQNDHKKEHEVYDLDMLEYVKKVTMGIACNVK